MTASPTTATPVALDDYVATVRDLFQRHNGERDTLVREISPLMERFLWTDDLLDPQYELAVEGARTRWIYHSAEDGSLQIYMVEFTPHTPTPVHDHTTWGLIGIWGGQQLTRRYERLDDGSVDGRAELRLTHDEVYERGVVYPLVPPTDIHQIETVSPTSSFSLHVLGLEFNNVDRHVFDVETGTVSPFSGKHM